MHCIAMTKPRVKSTTNNVLKKVQTEKNTNYKRLVLQESSDDENDYVLKKMPTDENKIYKRLIVFAESSDDEDDHVLKKVQTDQNKKYNRLSFKESSYEEDDHIANKRDIKTNKIKNSHEPKDDNSTGPRRLSTARIKLEINYQQKLKELCDSDSDSDNKNCQPKNLPKRKLNFDNISEFESEDIAPQKITTVDKPVDFSFVKQDTILPLEQQPVENCFPPLSKGASLKNTDIVDLISSPQNVLKIKKNSYQEKLKLEHCNWDSDSDDANWKPKSLCKRKLSFDNISEFNPENTVPLKIRKIEIPVDSSSLKQKTSLPTKDPPVRKSFLASLSKDVPLENADLEAIDYKVNYISSQGDLCKRLYKLFNDKVFDNKLPKDMKLEWNIRLQRAAGKCYHKKHLNALGQIVSRSSRIGLATKILDSPDKLRDVLIHEMCHAATWLINNISDGHGSFWKAWANKAMNIFSELPVISRCHNYDTKKKYTYRCISCGHSYGRIRRSLDLKRKCCAKCHGKFELLINKV